MAKKKNGTKSVVKFVAGPIRNLGNIAGALNSNIPIGRDFAHGLAAMRRGLFLATFEFDHAVSCFAVWSRSGVHYTHSI